MRLTQRLSLARPHMSVGWSVCWSIGPLRHQPSQVAAIFWWWSSFVRVYHLVTGSIAQLISIFDWKGLSQIANMKQIIRKSNCQGAFLHVFSFSVCSLDWSKFYIILVNQSIFCQIFMLISGLIFMSPLVSQLIFPTSWLLHPPGSHGLDECGQVGSSNSCS